MLNLAITLAIFTLASFAESQCPSGWVNHGDMCYHFSHDKENWIDAQVVCEHFGGYLAELHSQFEDNFLVQESVRAKATYWVGASDMIVENEWRWLHSGIVLDYTHWIPNQPDNANGVENCMEISGPYNGWNDQLCTIEQFYICQKERNDGTEVIG